MDHQIAGVVLTGGDWLDDLWVAAGYRRRGIGSALLARGELEIAERGSAFARLRVVASNRTAVSFYLRYGWQLEREFPHESLPLVMLEMRKRV
jgi:ribosomal protein S18 acetylase RimI-like enzyme